MSCLTSIRSRWWCIQIEKKHWCNFNMDWMCENCLIKWLSQLVMTRYAIQSLLGTTCPNHVCGTSSKLPLPLKLHTFCDNCCHVWEWHPIGWDTCIKCPDDLVELSSSIIPWHKLIVDCQQPFISSMSLPLSPCTWSPFQQKWMNHDD